MLRDRPQVSGEKHECCVFADFLQKSSGSWRAFRSLQMFSSIRCTPENIRRRVHWSRGFDLAPCVLSRIESIPFCTGLFSHDNRDGAVARLGNPARHTIGRRSSLQELSFSGSGKNPCRLPQTTRGTSPHKKLHAHGFPLAERCLRAEREALTRKVLESPTLDSD